MQYLQVDGGRHMVTLSKSLQSLELVDRLIELTVDRCLVAHDSVDRRMRERAGSPELFPFMPRSYTEAPVFLGDRLNQNHLHRYVWRPTESPADVEVLSELFLGDRELCYEPRTSLMTSPKQVFLESAEPAISILQNHDVAEMLPARVSERREHCECKIIGHF